MSEIPFSLELKKPKTVYPGKPLQKIQINLLEQKPSDLPLSLPLISVSIDYTPKPDPSTHDVVISDLPLIGGSVVVEGVKIVAEAINVAKDKSFKITASHLSNEHHELSWAIPPTKKKEFIRLYCGPTEQWITVYGPNEEGASILLATPADPGGNVLEHGDISKGKFEWVDIKVNESPMDAKKLTGKFELDPN